MVSKAQSNENTSVPATTEANTQASDHTGYALSQRAADQCRQIVEVTATEIEGKKYVTVEGWQAIAIAHGCVASARDVEEQYSPDGKFLGYKAVGEVRRMDNGVVIATGEGFIGVDEVIWFGGKRGAKTYYPRPAYACRAMAQTRSISRACRSAFAHVVVIINRDLKTTPAEEMIDIKVYDSPPAPTPTDPPMMDDARRMSAESGYKPGDRFRGQNRKIGSPMSKDELLKKQDNQLAAAMSWVNDQMPALSLMTPEEIDLWKEQDEIAPRIKSLRQARDGQPGFEHLKPAWEEFEKRVKQIGAAA